MKRILAISLLAFVIALPSAGQVEAARVKMWHHHRPADQERARRKGVVQGDSGAIRLSRRLTSLARPDCTHVWCVVEDRAGTLYAGTGEEGKLFKVTPGGKVSLAYTAESSQVLCLATDSKGETVYAGTGPTARVVRLDSHGARVLCELPESYVWALAHDPHGGALYAATGPNGRIYKITAAGKASVFFETKQDHVLCLVAGPDGTLYAGTDKTGRVYRIDSKGKGFVLYQAAQSEVRALLLEGDVLYAGTSGTKKRSGGSTAKAEESSTASKEDGDAPERAAAKKDSKPEAQTRQQKPGKRTATKGKTASRTKAASKASTAPAPSAPAAGENSVYRISLDGPVREVFRDKVLVLSLARQGKRLLVATGTAGQLFEIDEATREKTELARLDHGQITSLCRRKDGSLVLGTGDPGRLYVLSDRFKARGTLISDVLDAKLVSKWGALRWRGEAPTSTSIGVAVRSGNVAEPDGTWSDWSADESDGAEATIKAPAARYLQYRVTLRTEDSTVTPVLRSLTLRYATTNQAPEVKKITVPDLGSTTLENPKKLKFKWSATDANEDELRYRLLVKKDGWERWVELEDDWEKSEYEWDTTTTPSGVYRLKVVASDRADNSAKDALTGEKVSAPFVVCHTPPVVKVKLAGVEDGQVVIEATASSPLVRLTSASFAVNAKKWRNVFPSDGLFDSKRETFRFRAGKLKAGSYVLVLKVTDAAGNTGSGDVVFTVPLRPVARK
jgi:hypothetical protein